MSNTVPPLNPKVMKKLERLKGRLPEDFAPTDLTVDTPAGPHAVPPAIQALIAVTWPENHEMFYRPFNYDWPVRLFYCGETEAGLVTETRPWLTIGYNDSQYYHLVDLSDTSDDPLIYDVDHEGDQDAGGGDRLSRFLTRVKLPKPAKPSERLARACATGDLTAVTECLKDSPNLGPVNSTGLTPLHIAVMNRPLDVVRALLDAGADPNARLTRRLARLPDYMVGYSWMTGPASGETPLDMALNSTPSGMYQPRFSAPLVHLLLDGGADPRLLSRGVRYLRSTTDWMASDFEEVLPRLVAAGFDLRKAGSHGGSLVQEATRSGGKLLPLLLENGIDPSDPLPGDRTGLTPLHLAVEFGHERNLRRMVPVATNLDVATKAGLTPLHMALNRKDTEFLEILLTAGADAKARVPDPQALADGLTSHLPADIARELGKPEAAALLDQATA